MRLLSALVLALLIPSTVLSQKWLKVPDVARDKVICFALYTVHAQKLKLTAQLYPLREGESRTVRLEVQKDGKWETLGESKVDEEAWIATFRVNGWDDSVDTPYRVRHGKAASYEGRIRKNPIGKDELVIAAFTGNSIQPAHGGDIPKDDIIANVNKIDADVLFFSGDQVYNHTKHLAAWLRFGREFGPIIKDRPTVTIPDDHDVGQPNLWGASGKKSTHRGGADGGYLRPVDYVKMVERAQTSHLPDPVDPAKIQRGIGTYFTQWNWGGVSMAILEDRKFKTGPMGLIPRQGPRPDHIRNPKYNPKAIDVPEAILLGKRQLQFLDRWGRDWRGAQMKLVLSQTIFCGGAHIHGKLGGRLHADLDSNGWPQAGRNKAIHAMRKCFALHVAGDQHLGTIFHHGIDTWRDGNFSFCVPSIANLYLRWWEPLEPGKNREPGMPPILGDHLDGFANHVTAYAAANPKPGGSGGKLSTRAAGFGVVRMKKSTQNYTMECWPRNVVIGSAEAKQYPGWPKTIGMQENYGRAAVGYLPMLQIRGAKRPVVTITNEANQSWVYSLRIPGQEFRPKVFAKGSYTIEVTSGNETKRLSGILSGPLDDTRVTEIEL